MRTADFRSISRRAAFAFLLAGGVFPVLGHPAEEPKAAAESASPPLVEAFRKGPIAMSAKVVRKGPNGQESSLPLFQVPVLKFKDRLELTFAGEAFDQRVTSAPWSVVVVFLPKTIAPTSQGVVDFRLKEREGKMVVPAIEAPYDSVPMIFLIPDKNGRKKVLKDLNAHLASFRTLCAKISELSAERATVDKFLEELDAIDKNQAPAQYDNAVLGFLNTYGDAVSTDVQAFMNGPSSNLDKLQFVTQEFRKTNVLVPDPAAAASPVQASVGVGAGGPGRPISAYVSIFFDVAAIIQHLWPGHQFQYLPALARNFHDTSADLYYNDWIHTTGDTLGALMCCPGKWEEEDAPAFDLDLPAGEAILKHPMLIRVRPKEKGRSPFSLFGHDWKLLAAGPKGESFPPVPLDTSPNKDAFVVAQGALAEAVRKAGAAKVQARVVGRWGFTSLESGPLELPAACDPAWGPSPGEAAAFQVDRPWTLSLPAPWAALVEKVVFRPADAKAEPLVAELKTRENGSREAVFRAKEGDAGPGTLEVSVWGGGKPALARPLVLHDVPPEVKGVDVRLGESSVLLRGAHLGRIREVLVEGRKFAPAEEDEGGRRFKAEDGKPVAGAAGHRVEVAFVLPDGGKTALEPSPLLPPRPRLAEAQVVPMELKGAGLPLACAQPLAPTNAPSQVDLIALRGYRFPSDGAFHAAIRNADEPSAARAIPASRIRVLGNNLKASFTLKPSDLLGGRASGRLEVQVVDEHAGPSDWMPLPPTFLDLPVISQVAPLESGAQLVGSALDPIEAVAASPQGPWEKASLVIEEGQERVKLATPLPGPECYLKVFGWPDLVLSLKMPHAPAPRPAEPGAAPKADLKGKAEAGAKAEAAKADPQAPAPRPPAAPATPAAPAAPAPPEAKPAPAAPAPPEAKPAPAAPAPHA